MSKKTATPTRRPIQLPADLWALLWQEARKRKEPTTPAQMAREILAAYFKK